MILNGLALAKIDRRTVDILRRLMSVNGVCAVQQQQHQRTESAAQDWDAAGVCVCAITISTR